ncbi:hypothetical protein F7725_013413 [Dissostichus mawsoni]|uniref:ABC transporter domain-containing protein n=1 Tax=Dissostichus mawsoni TaxID=36200 RepID=A0A7J5YRU5_DISMA|nr:hypothetical protein F7725_013413 [Dissostichus mawsoni]
MGFLHQLHLLLWKNISLKRRGPWVLAFEIFIPLVLFFILLGLRQKKPAIPVKEAFYSAAPLTSAGIIPIMQSLCPDGQRDEFGFLQYKNSTVTQLLERISEVLEQNHLFMSDRPGLCQELESLQQHLESLSSSPLPPDSSLNSSQGFQQFLVRNLSLSSSTASLLLNTPVRSLIFGTSLRGAQQWIHRAKDTRQKPENKEKLLGDVHSLDGGNQSTDQQALEELEVLTCGEGGASELSTILMLPEKQRPVLQAYLGALQLERPRSVAPLSQADLRALLKDLADMERLLKDVDLLSGLARLLPKGACAGRTPASPTNMTWPLNATTWGPNTTDIPGEEGGGGAEEGGGTGGRKGKEEAENPHSQFSAFVQLWAGLQPILCGHNRIIEPEALKQGNMSSLGFTSKEQRNLGLLVHLMTTNPKILYSPIGSQVDKANETFAFVGNVTHYTRVWLNISAQLRTFLEEGRLHNHLVWLQQLSSELQQHPELLNGTDSELMQGLMEGNYSLPNISILLEQMDTIDNAACGWTRFMSKVSVDVFKGFPNEDSIVNYTLNQAYQDNVSVFASVIVQTNKDGSLPSHVLYKIRQNSSFTEKTNEIRRAYWRPGPNTGGKFYFLYGFVWIQDMMERAFINTFVGHDVVEPGNYVQMFPYPSHDASVHGDEDDGLNNAVHWVAWFITGFVQLSISVTALTVILKYGRVLLHSDPFIIWLFLTIYAVATIIFLVSVIYSKAKLASACGGIIYFLSYVPYMYVAIREEVAHDKITAFEKCIASLMSTTAFGLGSKYFALYEVAGVGIQWRTISQSPVEGDDFNLGLSMMMLMIDAGVYGVLTWYIEAVHPGMYGLPRPWYFPLQRSYWSGSGRVETWDWPWCGGGAARLSVMEEDQACAMDQQEMRGIEEEPSHLSLVVCIDKLTKVYKTGSKLALDKLSLNLHENQVVSFLGHNGAGKTTTMSILTGLFPPTSGSATIYGHDIRTEMERIRQNLGMCPQHNVLFDKLSVEEHLMIVDLELSKKRHSLVQTLSGGMKRKLSVAIAFVGGSRAVILDEPTAGVDPYARRAIWDLILKYKQGRTILLSTHNMDEADLLGDRIAIISHGKLKCCGSPLFLKSTYGDGYKLTLVKKQNEGRGVCPFSIPALNCSCCHLFHLLGCQTGNHGHFYSQTDSSIGDANYQTTGIFLLGQGSQQQPPSSVAPPSSLSPSSSVAPSSSLSPSSVAPSSVAPSSSSVAPSSYVAPSSLSPCSQARVSQFIGQFVASCVLVSDSNTELSYVLPSEAVKKGCFERLFQSRVWTASPSPASVMDTTLEEVFLKVSEEDQSLENSDAGESTFFPQLLLFPLSIGRHEGVSGGSSVGKSSVGSAGLGLPQEGSGPSVESENPEVELSNLMSSSTMSQSQSSLKSSSSIGSVRGDEGGLHADFYGDYYPLFDSGQEPDSAILREPEVLEGQGSFKLEGWWLKLSQFHGLIVKRFHCAKRNTKGLFSQILLPAFFVCVAMTVALSVPEIGDLPPLILSPSQYHNYTQPRGNFIPYTNEDRSQYRIRLSPDASPQKIINTSVCPRAWGPPVSSKPPSTAPWTSWPRPSTPANNSKTLAARYFDSMCLDSFTQGVPFSNFVPPPPSPAPSDDPDPGFEDGLWNYTAAHPTAVRACDVPPTLPLSLHEPVRCTCSMQGTGFSCPSGVGGRPPLMKVVTGDILVDITGRNVSEYLLFTSDRLRLHRNIPPMVRKIAVRRSAQVLYNNKGYHSMPTYLNVLNNAILRANLAASKGNPAAYGFTLTNHPMNRTSASLSLDYLLQGTDVVIAIFIIVAMSFVPASFVVFLVAEKSTKAKHLQFVSGCDPVIYWLANYIWTWWSITPIMYPASFWFEVPSTAYVFLIVINLFIGITATVATFLLQLFEHDKDLKRINSYLKSCFLIFPNYNLGHGLMEMAYNEYINEYYAKIGQFDKMKSPFEWDIVTRGLVAMTIEGFVGFLITILCQRMPVSCQPIDDDDEDGSYLGCGPAVSGRPAGECFGLLGVNGAGKTTTFKMLTGDESTTGGEAFINGNSILKDLLCVQQSIGYCPQFDALFDDLTAREHLELYTRLRGIPWKDQERVVQWALEKLELSKYADKPAGTYSGGNKRKLSTAIALIGYPSLIFLDEPTTGMDPKARRFLWNLILDIIKTGRSVVLTSHSMEECEALCTRLGIMVNGRFKCLGSIQHLKNRFGDGYMITVRTKSSSNVKEVLRFFNRNFPEAVLKERHHTKIQYQLKSERISLAQVFSKMEQVVEVLGIEDYSVSQTTLDNVFVNFAKKQSDNLDQQEVSPPVPGQSPLQRILNLLKSRPAPTELSALISEAPAELESDDDEGLISFEEERIYLHMDVCLAGAAVLQHGHSLLKEPLKGREQDSCGLAAGDSSSIQTENLVLECFPFNFVCKNVSH